MKTLLTSSQLRDADTYSLKHLPISSIRLMEQASKAFVKIFKKEYPNRDQSIAILCGQGNNGGDGLAIARLLKHDKYQNISVYLINFGTKKSNDYSKNLERLGKAEIQSITITEPNQIQKIKPDLIIDAILGSGLNRPFIGKYANLSKLVNRLNAIIVSVDVPTGFNTEKAIPAPYKGIKADLVITFDLPKINFFLPESVNALKKFKVASIGLDKKFIENQPSDWKLTDSIDIQKMLKERQVFSHKGTYGHALLIAGNTATMGAALLASKACLHAGAGLTTVCLPQSGIVSLNTALPEVMALPRNEYLALTVFEKFDAIAVGPGWGDEEENETMLRNLIKLKKPLVLDADALTILSIQTDLLDALPKETILTPHLKEFDRLFGEHKNWWERIATAKKEAKARGIIIVLKNQYTFVCLPTGKVHINPTGNPAMASGGMGDVLTGVITALMAQAYSSTEAALIGVYVHGKAGDKLAKKRCVVTASEVAKQISKTMASLR